MNGRILQIILSALAGAIMTQLYLWWLVKVSRLSLTYEARRQAADAPERTRLMLREAAIKVSLAPLLFICLAGVPITLQRWLHQFGSDRHSIFAWYFVGVIAVVVGSLPKLVRWVRQYQKTSILRCPHCGKRNEKPRHPGEQGWGHFARIAVQVGDGLRCSSCSAVLPVREQPRR